MNQGVFLHEHRDKPLTRGGCWRVATDFALLLAGLKSRLLVSEAALLQEVYVAPSAMVLYTLVSNPRQV